MKITVVFDNLEEFQRHMTTGAANLAFGKDSITVGPEKILPDTVYASTEAPPEEAAQKPAPAPEEPKAEKKPKEFKDTGTGAIRGATPEEQKQIEAEEKVKVETVRKLLADLNKAAGKNVAKDLIKELGFKRLTDVPEEKLPALQKKAEEVMAKYA